MALLLSWNGCTMLLIHACNTKNVPLCWQDGPCIWYEAAREDGRRESGGRRRYDTTCCIPCRCMGVVAFFYGFVACFYVVLYLFTFVLEQLSSSSNSKRTSSKRTSSKRTSSKRTSKRTSSKTSSNSRSAVSGALGPQSTQAVLK